MELFVVVAALVGAFSHWLKAKYISKRLRGNPIDYIITHPWHTAATVGTVVAAVAALSATGAIEGMATGNAILTGFLTGYTADSATNKGPESR